MNAEQILDWVKDGLYGNTESGGRANGIILRSDKSLWDLLMRGTGSPYVRPHMEDLAAKVCGVLAAAGLEVPQEQPKHWALERQPEIVADLVENVGSGFGMRVGHKLANGEFVIAGSAETKTENHQHDVIDRRAFRVVPR